MKKNVICLLFSGMFFVTCTNYEDLEFMDFPRPNDSYDYPIRPGSDEWASLTSGQQMLEACQIPVEIVSKMSTQALIQAIWEHPMLVVDIIIVSSNYQKSFESMFIENKNNAYVELVNRTDAGTFLLQRYALMDPLTPDPPLIQLCFELLISQPVLLVQLDNKEKKKVVEYAFQKDKLRQNNLPENSIVSPRLITKLLIGRTMVAANYMPFLKVVNSDEEYKLFLEGVNSQPRYDYIIQDIIRFGKQFLTKK